MTREFFKLFKKFSRGKSNLKIQSQGKIIRLKMLEKFISFTFYFINDIHTHTHILTYIYNLIFEKGTQIFVLRKITARIYRAISLTAMERRARGNLPTRSIQRWRLMIVWPSNYRVLLPSMCNFAKTASRIVSTATITIGFSSYDQGSSIIQQHWYAI